jgi:hypothetical protein
VLYNIKDRRKTCEPPLCYDEKQRIRKLARALAPYGGKKQGFSIVKNTIHICNNAYCVTSILLHDKSVRQRRTACDKLAWPKHNVTL